MQQPDGGVSLGGEVILLEGQVLAVGRPDWRPMVEGWLVGKLAGLPAVRANEVELLADGGAGGFSAEGYPLSIRGSRGCAIIHPCLAAQIHNRLIG